MSYLVAKVCPVVSRTCTMSKEPGCRSRDTMVPTRPKFLPPVIMHRFPDTNKCYINICMRRTT